MYEDKDMLDPAGNDETRIGQEMARAQRELGGSQSTGGFGFGGGRVRGSKWM